MTPLVTAALGIAFALAVGAAAVARLGVDARRVLVVAVVLVAAGGVVAQVAPVDAGTDGPAAYVGADRPAATTGASAAASTATPAAASGAPTVGDDATTATVVGAVSGDRLTYRTASGTRTVGLVGLDAPGVGGDDPRRFDGVLTGERGRTCLATHGRRALLSLRSLEGASVRVRLVETDRGATRAVVTREGRSINRRLVERGHARATGERYAAAEGAARSARRGLWSCGVVSPERPLRAANETAVRIAAIHPNPPGDDASALDGEYVVVENVGRETVDLSNWYLTDGEDDYYFFFEGRTLVPGARIVVHVGEGTNRPGHVYWGANSPVLDNDHDSVKLVDGDSDRVVGLTY